MRESLVLYCCLDNFFEFLEFLRMSFFRELASCFCSKCYRIDRSSCIPFWSCLRHCTNRSGCRCLSSCECIVLIVEYNICHIKISTTRMDEVSHTNSIPITITSNYHNNKIRISEFDSSSKWNGTTMESLCCISIDILTWFSTTTHSWDDHSLMRWYSEFFECVFDCHDNKKVSTSRTPLYVCESASHRDYFVRV